MSWWPRRPIWASALAIGAFQLIGSFGAASNQPDRKPMDWLAVMLVLTGPAALGLLHRWPLVAVAMAMAAADVYVGLGYAFGPIFVSVVASLFAASAGRLRRPRVASTWLLAGAGYIGFVIARYADPRDDGPTLAQLALVAGWLAVVLAVAEVVRARRAQAAERRAAERDAREREVSEQRLGLAQELHDVLAHNISMINVQASVALHLLDTHPERARPALASIKQASRDALHELRTALDVLRRGDDAPRAPAPRLDDLDTLLDGVRAGGLHVALERTGGGDPLPAAVELAAYRIVQEALTNVARHARASSVQVRVERNGGVAIEVVDDGIGGTALAGNGIRGMRERAAALGGTVEAGPRAEGGFRVAAHLPSPAVVS